MSEILPVILSGGAGTRLWPASRSQYPKQLLSLGGDRTLLQATALRMDGMPGAGRVCTVVCNEAHRFLVAEQLLEIGREATIILEPEGRNTAPAVALAALLAAEADPDQLLLVMPADHRIRQLSEFQATILRGIPAAREGRLVTFGTVPVRAETGFGYVRAEARGTGPVPVIEFVEKPDRKTAQAYVSSGHYFWNSGIFLFTARCFLDTLAAHAPDIHAACTASIRGRKSGADFTRPDAAAFLACRSDSIDYAVMENTDRAAMVPLDAGWSDVGSWEALHAVSDSDNDNNSVSGDVLLEGCRDTYVSAESRLVAAVGLDDMVIVETRDSILVARKSRSQDVKAIVDRLKSLKRGESELHRKVFRPWGSFDSLECRDGFQVKRLVIRPGAVISLQRHAHRVEHWIVVKGRARVTRNDEEFDIGVNESAHIGIGDVHRIANPFDEPVHIIEVQCGDYLGEDDIERLEEYLRQGRHDDVSITIECFKAYDVRGRIPDQLNEDIARRIANAAAAFLGAKTIVVGRDMRLSSAELTDAVVRGLVEAGANVLDIGLCGTEMVYFAVMHLEADGGIMITASHNPADYNGLKIVREEARPVSADTGLVEIRRLAESDQRQTGRSAGARSEVSIFDAYIEHMLSYVDRTALKPLKLVVNAGNGCAGLAVDGLEPHLPFEFVKLNHDPDGTFPNGIPNPLLPENRSPTIDAVRSHGAAMGVAWDGDFDRCFFFDDKGGFIEGYYVVGLLAESLLRSQPGGRIVHDPRLTWNTLDIVASAGGVAVQSKSGHSFMKEKMRDVDAVYGGEMSAHHYFRDFSYADSGMIPWLLVAALVSETGKNLSQLVSERQAKYPTSGEINRTVPDADTTLAMLHARYSGSAENVDDIDGYSFEFSDWRFNIRASNTEPVIRLNIETRADPALLEVRTRELLTLIDECA